ncbi:hypothetical protein Pfo_029203 [Paulownia fortunei]|nr:hypothetical protein Pfo_029203 [Paulownia fortunei]
MAYRRRQGMGRSSTFKEDIYQPSEEVHTAASSSLVAHAIRASAAHRDSSHSSAYAHPLSENTPRFLLSSFSILLLILPSFLGVGTYDYTSMGSSKEAGSFWGVLARKAKTGPEMLHSSRIEKEGRTIVENKTADFIQETRNLQIRRKGINSGERNLASGVHGPWQQSMQSQNQTSQEDQLKASRDVAMATAAKAKLLLRELKTVKADLTFAKQRCSQLEEENKILKRGSKAIDRVTLALIMLNDNLKHIQIRLQLETLLAEKARLAHENSVYARENRFLREIVEYHQLTMQDVVYLDEGIEEVTEVYPVPAVFRTLSVSPPSPMPPPSPFEIYLSRSSSLRKEMLPALLPPREAADIPETQATLISSIPVPPHPQEESTRD